MSVSNLSIYCLNDHFIFKFSYSVILELAKVPLTLGRPLSFSM